MEVENQDGYSPYNSLQSLRKAMKKAKHALSLSTRKHGAVLRKLCEPAILQPKQKKQPSNKISDEIRKLVMDFYSCDEISY